MSGKKETAKDIMVFPISGSDARFLIKKYHYSGKNINNSQLHYGVFLHGRCLGAMSFGPPLDKSKVIGLVAGTRWNDMLELNRMAFSERLPRFSESRALAFALRSIKKRYQSIGWILSFSDACQSGDGTIYRACGFVLTGIKSNTSVRINDKTGEILSRMGAWTSGRQGEFLRDFSPIPGFMLRYIYFLDRGLLKSLTVPVLPFSAIDDAGAGMYCGKKKECVK